MSQDLVIGERGERTLRGGSPESDSGFCLSKIYSKLLSCLTCRLFVKNGTANLYQDWVLDRGLGKILVNDMKEGCVPTSLVFCRLLYSQLERLLNDGAVSSSWNRVSTSAGTPSRRL